MTNCARKKEMSMRTHKSYIGSGPRNILVTEFNGDSVNRKRPRSGHAQDYS